MTIDNLMLSGNRMELNFMKGKNKIIHNATY